MQVSNNNKYTPNFKALPVAKIASPQDKITLLILDKNSDKEIINNLIHCFSDGDISERFPNSLQAAIRIFMKNAFESIDKIGIKGVISINNGVPSGIVTYGFDDSKNEVFIDYLASWIPVSLKKVKNNGTMLVRHVYQGALNNRVNKVAVKPGFKSLPFYKKLGFKTENSETFIDGGNIKKQINKLKSKFSYEILDGSQIVNIII